MVDASASEGSIPTISDARDEDAADRPRKARRTFLTQNACRRCRQKKSKCDGKRPTCQRCEKNGADCVYDVAQEGLTRMQSLQQRVEESEGNLRRMTALVDALRTGSDGQASNLLARLRLGEDIENLTSFLEVPSGGEAFGRPEAARDSPDAPDVRTLHGWAQPQTVPSQGQWSPWVVSAAQSSHGSGSQSDITPGDHPYRMPERMVGVAGPRPDQLDSAGPYRLSRDEYYRPDPSRYFDPAQWQRARAEEDDGASGGSSSHGRR